MKKITFIIFVFIFTTPLLFSQEISEDFLKTLPPGMQDDVKKRAAQQGDSDDPIYNSLETQTKLEKNSWQTHHPISKSYWKVLKIL